MSAGDLDVRVLSGFWETPDTIDFRLKVELEVVLFKGCKNLLLQGSIRLSRSLEMKQILGSQSPSN